MRLLRWLGLRKPKPDLDAVADCVPTIDMNFCGEPTADGDAAAEYLRVYYDRFCPELQLGGWRGAFKRWLRRIVFGYIDYDVDRDRHRFLSGLISEVNRIEAERFRQTVLQHESYFLLARLRLINAQQ